MFLSWYDSLALCSCGFTLQSRKKGKKKKLRTERLYACGCCISQQQFNKRSSSYVDIALCCPLFANGWKSHEQTLGKPVLLQELAVIRSRTMHLKLGIYRKREKEKMTVMCMFH
jgi:hypothetical protein